MSDRLMRGVRVQLTTTMDSVLKTAVFEVMRIFESALYDHKMEMAQKGEEIAQLKVKLQAAELKLKDFEFSNQRLHKAEITNTQAEPEVVPDNPGQSTTVPEIDVEVPDDWCAPLGYDTATKQDEGVCPSVRLRQFSIRLYPVPLVKHEEDNHVINAQKSPVSRRSKRISTMNEKPKQTQDKNPPVVNQAGRRPKLSGDLNKLLKDLNQDYCNLKGLERLRKRKMSEGTLSDTDGKEKDGLENSLKHKGEDKRSKHVCGSCCRVFGTNQGLCTHLRSQKKCKGCSMVFCFLGAAKYHMRVCPKYKEWNERRCLKTTRDKKNALGSTNRSAVIIRKESKQSSADGRTNFTQRYFCKQCSFKTRFIQKFRKHMAGHFEKVETCSICPEKFDERRALTLHMIKEHKSHVQHGKKKP